MTTDPKDKDLEREKFEVYLQSQFPTEFNREAEFTYDTPDEVVDAMGEIEPPGPDQYGLHYDESYRVSKAKYTEDLAYINMDLWLASHPEYTELQRFETARFYVLLAILNNRPYVKDTE